MIRSTVSFPLVKGGVRRTGDSFVSSLQATACPVFSGKQSHANARRIASFPEKTGQALAMTLLFFFIGFSSISAQQPNDLIEKGNAQYEEGKFGEAEMTYREGLESGADPFISGFNLGDALFKQERFEEAATTFQSLPNLTENKEQKAAAFHNLGNSFLKAEKYQESVDAYKQSLRNDPSDMETKYNYSYARRMLQQEQEQQKQDQKDKKDDKKDEKKDQDKKDGDKDKDKKDQQKKDEEKEGDKDKKDQQPDDQKQDEKKEQQPQENKISKEDAQRMLDALDQEEKKIRDRLEKQKVKKGVKGKIEKDW